MPPVHLEGRGRAHEAVGDHHVVAASEFEGPIEVRIKGRREQIPLGLARAMFVTVAR